MSSRHLPSARSDASPSAESLLVELRHAPSPEAAASLCERIVDLTLALADMVARSFQYRGIETDDLIQVARLGLMKAIRGYDPAWKCSFAAYAAPTISGEIKRHFRDQGWLVKPPRSVQELRGRMATEEQGLVNRLHRHPTTQEFATHLGVDVAAVTDAKIATRGFAAESLTEFDESHSLVEAAMSGQTDQGIVDRLALRIALQRLTEAQRRLLRWRFADDLTQTEIAARIGTSQMQVSRLLRKCVTDLRALMETEPELDGGSGRGSSMESAAGSTADSRRCSRGRADASNRHVSERRRRFVELQRRHIHELDEHVAAEEMRAERILQRDAAKTRFYQNASHEFRTPLTVLHMAVEVLRPLIAPQAEGQLVTIARAVDQLDRLVEELLTFVREERDALDPLLEPVNLAEATRTVTSMFRTLASRAGLELLTEIEPIGCVLVNPEAWNRIVANLVSNAVKYTPEGSVTVRLFSADDEVHLEVVDTGMGIAEDDASAVSSRFGRGEAARSIDAGGLGLGLSMVYDLVRAHDGSIRVQSRAGEGSTFAVRLPRRPVMSEGDGEVGLTVEAVARVAETTVGTDPAAGILAPAHTPSQLPDLEEAPSQGRLLLVEDDEDLRRYLTTFLTSEGWQVDAVADVPGALAFSQPPDLVLADVMLPGPSGLDLLRLLRTQSGWDRLPIVLLTARAAPHEVIEGLNAGADDYIVKPFRASELSARLAVHVEMAGRREQALIEAENRSDNLHEALKSNRRIGLSLGILMSRYRVTDEVAFEMLRRVSNDSNQRIRDIAEEVILTGSLDTSQRARPDPSLREQEVGRGRVPDGDQ